MTARQLLESVLTELSKEGAPSLLLLDYNYFINKAINNHINKGYNVYDVNQQTTDDLRVLKATAILDVTKSSQTDVFKSLANYSIGAAKLYDATYEATLPDDYLHLLNCTCIYKLKLTYKCYDAGDTIPFAATRLTADSWSTVLNNYFTRPTPERPYFYIHNVNILTDLPTAEGITDLLENSALPDIKDSYLFNAVENGVVLYTITAKLISQRGTISTYEIWNSDTTFTVSLTTSLNNGTSTVVNLYYDKDTLKVTTKKSDNTIQFSEGTPVGELDTEFPRNTEISLQALKSKFLVSTVEKPAGLRHGNQSKVRLEIRYGHDTKVFELVKVLVDYLKVPQYVRLTQELMNLTEDTSLILEFPDYVCQEIINELVNLIMSAQADPRLQSHYSVSLSIASPAQQLAAAK